MMRCLNNSKSLVFGPWRRHAVCYSGQEAVDSILQEHVLPDTAMQEPLLWGFLCTFVWP